MAEMTPPYLNYNPDDTVCAHCGDDLPTEPHPDSWAFTGGFCDAGCAALWLIGTATWGSEISKREIVLAVTNLAKAARRAGGSLDKDLLTQAKEERLPATGCLERSEK